MIGKNPLPIPLDKEVGYNSAILSMISKFKQFMFFSFQVRQELFDTSASNPLKC